MDTNLPFFLEFKHVFLDFFLVRGQIAGGLRDS